MTTYNELKAMPLDQQAQVWESMDDNQRAAVMAEMERAKSGQPPAEEPSAWERLMRWEPFSPETVQKGNALGTGLAQGLTFGYSEELGSLPTAAGNWLGLTDDTAEAYRARKRTEQESLSTSNPGWYLTGEIAGALAPTLIPGVGALSGPVKGYQAATLPGRIAVSATRGAVMGGLDAALQASGRAEGGLLNRGVAGLEAAPTGAAFGAVAGPVFEVGISPMLNAVTSKFGRTTTVAVERNLRDVAERTGMSTDEIPERVAAGQPMAGINDTTRMVARTIRNLSPSAGEDMIQGVTSRLDDTVPAAVDDVKKALVGPQLAAAPNLRAAVTDQMTTARRATGEALEAGRAGAGVAQSFDTVSAIASAASRSPDIADSINATLRRQGVEPLFKKVPGGVSLVRMPTIQEAEWVTAELSDAATSAFKGSGGVVSTTSGTAYSGMSSRLRNAVDDEVPSLVPLREANSAAITAQKDAFPLGLTSRSTAPDKFSVDLDAMPSATGAIEGARMGTAVRIAEDVGRNRRDTALIDELMDPDRYLGRNVDMLAQTPVNRSPTSPLAIAQGDNRLLDALAGNSLTAAQQEALAALKGVSGLQPISKVGLSQPWMKLADTVQKVLGEQTGLDEAGLRMLAQTMMQSGPEGQAILAKILKGVPLLRGETLSLGRMAASVSGAAAGSATNPGAYIGERGISQTILDLLGAQ